MTDEKPAAVAQQPEPDGGVVERIAAMLHDWREQESCCSLPFDALSPSGKDYRRRQARAVLSALPHVSRVAELEAEVARLKTPSQRPKLGKCAACDNYADPRFSRRHPDTGEFVFICDGCPPNENDGPEYEEDLMRRIRETTAKRAALEKANEAPGG
jgi:hypothetical protein